MHCVTSSSCDEQHCELFEPALLGPIIDDVNLIDSLPFLVSSRCLSACIPACLPAVEAEESESLLVKSVDMVMTMAGTQVGIASQYNIFFSPARYVVLRITMPLSPSSARRKPQVAPPLLIKADEGFVQACAAHGASLARLSQVRKTTRAQMCSHNV